MITAIVLTKNSQKTIEKTLKSLTKFPEVVVLDSGSEDQTLAIAEKFPNVKTYNSPFLGFGPMHNYAAKLASYDWILSIDSDETLSPPLIEEILSLKLDPEALYHVRRHNYFNEKHIRGCSGWHPDIVPRLYHRKSTQFSNDLVHEKVLQKKLIPKTLHAPLLHTPYLEVRDFLEKMQHYSELFAEQRKEEQGSLFQALIHSWAAFLKSYFLKKGFCAGREGFVISMYTAHTAFYKYLKLTFRHKM